MRAIQWKNVLPVLAALAIFYLLSLVYFSPMLEGKQLIQHDIKQWQGMAQEVEEHRELTGEEALWTGSMFSGMPAYQISVKWGSNLLLHVNKLFNGFLPRPGNFLFLYLLGMYIFLRILKVDNWLSVIGAIAFAFSSYFFVILPAGHTSKASAIGYMPLVLGGVYLLYRSRRMLLGAALLALFLGLEIAMNHVQVTYYLGIVLLLFVLAEFVACIRTGTWIDFIKRSGLGVVAVVLALLCNLGLLWSTWEYGKFSTRGPSELTIQADGTPAESVRTTGLDKDYVTRWSYGIEESFTLLIPDAKGGASGYIGANEPALDKADRQMRQFIAQQNRYWGAQDLGTSGPVYLGAIVILLMLLLLAQVREHARWWLLAALPIIILLVTQINDPTVAFAVVAIYLTAGLFLWREPLPYALFSGFVLTLMLSWGRNYMPLTDFFLDHVPGYNKFRAVTIVLVIASLTAPVLGILYMDKLLRDKGWDKITEKRSLIMMGVLAFFLLFLAVSPGSLLDLISDAERDAYAAQADSDPKMEAQIVAFVDSLKQVRGAIFSADAWRSFGFVVAAGLLIFLFGRRIINSTILLIGLGVLMLFDLWVVDKRYMHNEMARGRYAQWEEKGGSPHKPNASDLAILSMQEQDPSARGRYDELVDELREAHRSALGAERMQPDQEQLVKFGAMRRADHYRVLNLGRPFDDARTSFFHRSIGGYHGAKLKRYQELIEFHLSPTIQNISGLLQKGTSLPQIDSLLARQGVLNMLNTRYLVFNPEKPPIQNLNGFGAGWFVNDVRWVKNSDEEIQVVGDVDLQQTVVVDERYKEQLGDQQTSSDPSASVELMNYETNELTYTVRSSGGGVVVFSEIWYGPDWQAYVDGQAVDHVRGNYVLRALRVPAGEHEIVFKIESRAFRTSGTVMLASSLLLVLLVLGMLALELRAWMDGRTPSAEVEA
jgi:hypothetical protein